MTEQNKVQVNVPSDKAEARYSDFAIIGKNALGFRLDFGQRMPQENTVSIVSRIAMSPEHAKLFLMVLEKNVKDYEQKFGSINVPKGKPTEETDKIVHFVK